MQAAMRLRKLGTTQSVVFFSPNEVHQAVLDSRPSPSSLKVDSRDVIRWILISTAASLESLIPLYYSNGANFINRSQAAWDNSEFLYDAAHTKEFLHHVREKEKLTLNWLYMPRHSSKVNSEVKEYVTAPHLKTMFRELTKRRRAFQDTGDAVHASAQGIASDTPFVIDNSDSSARNLSRKLNVKLKLRWKSRPYESVKILHGTILALTQVFTQISSRSSRLDVLAGRNASTSMLLQP